ncbi:hypothetical protein PISMIDRAFT_405744 [Pisolithus microcarpus 441]|uniref:Uncharacterized protein n=1 Tax=Pisolithus microcarpus 441 TaxID=765257 RepID=A0A0C9XLT0_9AGAM|nr:hypothetical protein PISMIDRAFT_405744 [Pisolithus microcarpus 441]
MLSSTSSVTSLAEGYALPVLLHDILRMFANTQSRYKSSFFGGRRAPPISFLYLLTTVVRTSQNRRCHVHCMMESN